MLVFSGRIPKDLQWSSLARMHQGVRKNGIDLTLSNPTQAGIAYPEAELGALFNRPENLKYDPEPFGMWVAREAVAQHLSKLSGRVISPKRICLTSSTSEAYSFLLKLLADPGDEVAVPEPSYPLFEPLSRLEGVTPVPYQVRYGDEWRLDFASLDQIQTSRTRAVVVIHPNNPTGSYLKDSEQRELVQYCGERDLPIIADEVFYSFSMSPELAAKSWMSVQTETLVFTLGGISKLFGLPQLKLSWIALNEGKGALEALQGLEWIADTYLSVGTPIQNALPGLFTIGDNITEQILDRVRSNYFWLKDRCRDTKFVECLEVEGGWSAILKFQDALDEEAFALKLAETAGVAIHPGYFFDLPFQSSVVISLLPSPAIFRNGIEKVLGLLLR